MSTNPNNLPWRRSVNNLSVVFDSAGEIACDTYGGDHPREVEEANAAFIVKAVNAHDKLVEALKALRMAVSYRAACVIDGDASKIAFANEKVWKAHEDSAAALAAAGEPV